MRLLARTAVAGALILLTATAAGCGGDHAASRAGGTAARSTTHATPSPTPSCSDAGPTRITFGPQHLSGPLFGAGDSGVVLANQSDRDWCGWFPLPSSLGTAKAPTRRYLGFDFVSTNHADDVVAAAAELRRRGVTHLVLVGASAGARAVLVAATRITPRVDGVVAFSPERRADLTPSLPKLRVPVLLVSAATDVWVPAADAKAIAAAIPARYRHQVIVPGVRHGIDLATYDAPAAARQPVVTFLATHAP